MDIIKKMNKIERNSSSMVSQTVLKFQAITLKVRNQGPCWKEKIKKGENVSLELENRA